MPDDNVPENRDHAASPGRHAANGPDTEKPAATPWRKVSRSLMLPFFFVIMFPLCYISAFHDPQPRHMPVMLAGPVAQTQAVRTRIAAASAGRFDVSSTTDLNVAKDRVLSQHAVGAIELGATPTLYVASAAGPEAVTVVRSLAESIAAAQGMNLRLDDLRPLPPGDPTGAALFYFLIICTIGGYITATALGQAVPNLDIGRKVGSLALMAVLAPVLVYLIGGRGFGAYTGSAAAIAAMIGIGALYVFLIGLIGLDCQILLGRAAIFVMLAIFVFLNFPSAGGAVPPSMLPPFWAFLHQFWPGASALTAVRSALYFRGNGVGQALLVLWAWAAVWLIALVVPVGRKLGRANALERAAMPT